MDQKRTRGHPLPIGAKTVVILLACLIIRRSYQQNSIQKSAKKGAIYALLSDSEAALQSISSFKNKENNPLIQKVINELLDIFKMNIKVHFIWIPGHAGIKGNMIVDEAARSGTA